MRGKLRRDSSGVWYNTTTMIMRIEINDKIVADPRICNGKPTFKGTRIMVWQILSMLKEGESLTSITRAFPDLTKDHIKAALDYAVGLAKGEKNIVVSLPNY